MATTKKQTPAQRAKAKRDAAVQTPPDALKGVRASIKDLELVIAGIVYPIGANIEGDTPWTLALDETGQITIPIRSPDLSLALVLGDEATLQETGIRCTIDDVVYVVSAAATDETGLFTLTLEDEVSWRLKQWTTFIQADRKTVTRAGFVLRMIHEASTPPLAPMDTFIPEVHDKQSIAKASTS
jgi:hypothetical protein